MSEVETVQTDGQEDTPIVEETQQEVTTPESEPEKTEDPNSPDKIQQKLAESEFKRRQQRRELEDAQKRLADVERAQREAEMGKRPEVPEMPDPYDDDYQSKMAARDKALTDAAAWDARAETQKQLEQQSQQALLNQQQQVLAEATNEYEKRGIEAGITQSEMDAHADRFLQPDMGATKDEIVFVLQDAAGPQIAKYLAENPIEANAFASMPSGPARLVHLATQIKEKAQASRVETTKAPDPVPSIDGAGGRTEDPHLKGAIFK